MSVEQTNERFRIRRGDMRGFAIIDYAGRSMDFAPMWVDTIDSRSAAEYACRLLNQGSAIVNPHAIIGCRVEVQS